ncbi:cyclic nucleotide-binding domain-containing protein [Spirosoma sp. HMF4905]|uniref:Cyclic nucleotide-binding domain-containing protein n=2 Tax=Spirosoma arboris TaxID=2682092 RepID=A0A7K1SEE4_9BACT|nr:cyclic nucleotide-binding domain-containing protein [Spirosoma arboris]
MNADYVLLTQTIRHWIAVRQEEESIITSLFEPRHIPANDFFLQAGDVCRYVGFVTKGLLRYYILDDGIEHTYDFSPEQHFTCNYESFLTKTPSTRFIQAIEDTSLLIISYDNLQLLYDRLREGQKFGRLVAEELFVGMLQKLTSFYKETAEERYDTLLRSFPDLQERVPQYVIASYVGIKPQSLSRIRAQRAGKQY